MAADVAFWRDGNVIHLVCEEMTMIKNEIIARNNFIFNHGHLLTY